MPSPFPGMNPYLEQEDTWGDFHERFIPAAAEAIGQQVRPNYIVKIEQNVYIRELPDDQRQLLGRPDVLVAELPPPNISREALGTIVAPTHARLPLTMIDRESFIEIRDRENRQVITAVELLSPSNKNPGADREQYLAKRNQYLASGIHLVEIDLLRGGPRLPLEPSPSADYCIVVSRAQERPVVDVWPVSLRERLPIIAIPLRPADGDARLDLQQILHRVYDAAGYADYIYRGQPAPPLLAPDAEWAATVARV